MDREEAIRRLNDAQVAWARISEVRDLIHHPALRRVAVRLPNGAEVRVPRPGREGLSGEMPIVPEMGADTGRIRRGFGSAVMANADLGVADLASLLKRGRSSDGRRKGMSQKGGEAYSALAIVCRLWRGFRSFPRRHL
jgi:hypothetical protein